MAGIILGAGIRGWRNRIAKEPARLVAVVLAVLIGAFTIGGAAFAVGAVAAADIPTARDPILVAAFTALSVLILVLGFPSVIAVFFSGRDLLQLVLAPVRPIDIFLARSVLALIPNVLLGSVILAVVFGVGVGADASLLYFPIAVLLVLAVVLTITAVQLILMTAVLRWVPARIARDVAVLVAGVTGAGLYLASQLTVRQVTSRPYRGGPPGPPDVSGLVSAAQRLELLPTAWPGHALKAVIDGNVVPAAGWTAITFVFGTALVLAAAYLYERTLLGGLALFGAAPVRWRKSAATTEMRLRRGAGRPGRAIARKDWLVYRRDIRRLSRLLPALLFLVGYAVILSRPGLSPAFGSVAVVTFVSLFGSMVVAMPSIPSEHRAFQLLRMAPITPAQIIAAKVGSALLPVLSIATIISVASAVFGGATPVEIAQFVVLAIWIGTGFVCIGVATGAIDPRFDSLDDRRMVGIAGTFAGLAANFVFGACSIGAFVIARFAVSDAGGSAWWFLPASPFVAVLSGLVAVLLATAAVLVVGFMLWTANSRLPTFEATITAS